MAYVFSEWLEWGEWFAYGDQEYCPCPEGQYCLNTGDRGLEMKTRQCDGGSDLECSAKLGGKEFEERGNCFFFFFPFLLQLFVFF